MCFCSTRIKIFIVIDFKSKPGNISGIVLTIGFVRGSETNVDYFYHKKIRAMGKDAVSLVFFIYSLLFFCFLIMYSFINYVIPFTTLCFNTAELIQNIIFIELK